MQKEKKIPKIGIVIVSYNSQEYILNCLKSLHGNKYQNSEILIVDNASSDLTVEVVKKKYKKIRVIKNKLNVGFAAACNQGAKVFLNENAEYILLLNPDTVVSKNLLTKLLEAFDANSKVLVAGSIITYLKSPWKIWYAGGYVNNLFLYTKHKFMNENMQEVKIKSGITDFITGACILIKKETFNKIGFLPEDYFLYFEDVAFCKKINEKGYSCYFMAEPLVRHMISASSGTAGSNTISPIRAYYYARNPLLYIQKNDKGFIKITRLFGQFFIRLPYYSLQILKQNNLRSAFSYLKGLGDGLRGKSGKPLEGLGKI